MMLNVMQRNIIRGYLDNGMSPAAVADYLGRVNDLEPLDVITIKSAAYDLLNEPAHEQSELPGPSASTVIAGGS
jgi:hypothetical protein